MIWTPNLFGFQNLLMTLPVRVFTTAYALTLMGGIIPALIVSFHKADLASDRARAAILDEESVFDFIVVGAGSAGSVLGARLSEDPNYRVLVLEAGGEPNPLSDIPVIYPLLVNQPHIDWRFQSQPQSGACLAMKDGRANWPRGLGLGGSSNLNALMYVRGHPKDYDGWARMTEDSKWEYTNVLKLFKKSENYRGEFDDPTYHGKSGPLTVSGPDYVEGERLGETLIRAANEMGFNRIDLNARYSEGFALIESTIKNGLRASTYRAFLQPVRKRSNLSVYKFSRVHKVLLRSGLGSTLEAYGVEYIRHGRKRIAYAAKEVILSAGAIMSPHILMHSGIGPSSHLSENNIEIKLDRPGVGSNLQDHVFGMIGPFIIDNAKSLLLDRELYNVKSILSYLRSGTGPLGSGVTPAHGFLVSSYAQASKEDFDHPDLQIIMLNSGLASVVDVASEHAYNIPKEKMRKVYGSENFGKDSFFMLNTLVRPKSTGNIVLSGPDPNAYPLINPGYFTHPDDIKVLVEGAQRITDLILNSTAFRKLNTRLPYIPFPGCEEVPLYTDLYWECYQRMVSLTLYHPVGTCAMGKGDDPNAVVDSKLVVLGTSNLRVIDASIMPVITSANTNAPTIMIGEMGADFIKERWSENVSCDFLTESCEENKI